METLLLTTDAPSRTRDSRPISLIEPGPKLPAEYVGIARFVGSFTLLAIPFVIGLFGWAEWICLRSLQTGHSAEGGPTVVWIALGWLGVSIIGFAMQRYFLALVNQGIFVLPKAGQPEGTRSLQ